MPTDVNRRRQMKTIETREVIPAGSKGTSLIQPGVVADLSRMQMPFRSRITDAAFEF